MQQRSVFLNMYTYNYIYNLSVDLIENVVSVKLPHPIHYSKISFFCFSYGYVNKISLLLSVNDVDISDGDVSCKRALLLYKCISVEKKLI